jgi:chromosome segregation protein
MRLRKIKLAGFKSFVDPTTAQFPMPLSAVVGPNGCGKSNIIDAVRWVMGETSAKNLRGEAMADVIFNGSSARKPVGQASVELVFDNTMGTLGNEYANYAEIAIKRLVTRDGQSNYYLNNVRCRRKDITDIFLGTGLGPRSYAIIEQGMISKLIEAKPEELRNHLEEVSGISKYKERRRETEVRIRHTQENLDRLGDLKQELDKQLDTLARQAATAERYQILCAEEKSHASHLQAIRWRDLSTNIEMQQQRIYHVSQELEKVAAIYTSLIREVEIAREQQTERGEAVNQAQNSYYQIGSHVTRAEEEIRRYRERRTQLENDIQTMLSQSESLAQHVLQDEQSSEQANSELDLLLPQLEAAEESESQLNEARDLADALLRELQQTWEDFTAQSSQRAKQVEVLQARIVYLDETVRKADQRVQNLTFEKDQLSPDSLVTNLDELNQQVEATDEQIAQCKSQLENVDNTIIAQREWNKNTTREIEVLQKDYQKTFSELASLQAMQQVALGRQNESVVKWLTKYGLENKPRLAEKLTVSSGWEQAVEVVLGDCLQAVCVEEVDPIAHLLGDFETGSLTVFSSTTLFDAAEAGIAERLVDKVSGEHLPLNLLANVYGVETMQDALALRPQLQQNESVITKAGLWIGPNWIRVQKQTDTQSGVLERRQKIETLETEIQQLQQKTEQQKIALANAAEQLVDMEDSREQTRRELVRTQNAKSEIISKRSALQARFDQMQQRSQAIGKELAELTQQIDNEASQVRNMRSELQMLLDTMACDVDQRHELEQKRQQSRENVEKTRQAAQDYRQHVQGWRVKVSSLQTRRDTLQQNLLRMKEQLANQQNRIEQMHKEYADLASPLELAQQKLEFNLNEQVMAEQVMRDASDALNAVLEKIRQFEQQKSEQERIVQAMRDQLQQFQLDQQGMLVRRTTLEEAAEAEQIILKDEVEKLVPEDREDEFLFKLEEVRAKIKRLGAINLAAIEEFQVQSERKIYMDKQVADLTEALETLQRAIEKIDRETEERFRDTYEQVNATLQQLFPEMFGGGEAFLELVGEDLLETGVRIIARPPGKKNSSIHLLSGGEKALTAIALVFSLFKLNPAPFCLLDEVDAPLDDTNVERFCRLVKKMSETVQFIFITHNKIAMEMADQLTGVTMKEPGVSRLVSVDVNQATELVEATT